MTKNKRSNRKNVIKGVVAATLTGLPMAGAFTIANPAIVALAEDQEAVCSIGDAKYETLEAAVAAAKDGDTIKLLGDYSGNGIKVTPAGKFATGLTIDFDGHTYTVDGATVGSTGTETNGFQLLKDNTITFRNGTITSVKAKILVQNYSNLTLDNMTLTLENPGYSSAYTLSNNNGNVTIKDSTINANTGGGFAFDVCRYSSYPSVSVTVKGNSTINGNIELSASGSDPKDGMNLRLEGGTISGAIVLDDSVKGVTPASNGNRDLIDKEPNVQVNTPEGYTWGYRDSDGMMELIKKIDENTTEEALAGHAGIRVKGTSPDYEYKIYQILTAETVTPGNAASSATNVAWTDNGAVKSAVLAVLHDSDPEFEGDAAQDAAEYINAHIGDVKNSTSLADRLARALAGITPETTVKSEKVTNLDQPGFYLIITNPESVPEGYVGTSPIWLPWQAEANKITEVTPKEATTTLTKTVSENGTDFATMDDLAKGDEVTFKITAKLPDNYGAFETYKVVLTDTMPTGMSTPSNYEIKVGSTTIDASKYTIADGTITIDDLKTACSTANGGDELTVTYKSKLDNPTGTGTDNQYENTAKMTYPTDPVDPSKTKTIESKASVITYKMIVTKTDKSTGKPLADAKFVIKQGNKYLKADGTLVDAPSDESDETLAQNQDLVFTTGSDGTFAVSFVDSDTDYVIHEVATPSADYEKMGDVTVSFGHTAKLDDNGAKIDIATTGDSVVTDKSEANLGTGEIKVTISNTKEVHLPITGMTPNQLATSAGMILVVAGSVMVAIYASKSRKGSSEE